MKKKVIAAFLTATMVLSMTASVFAAEESDKAYVQDKGTLVIGITYFAPMDYND